MLAADAGLLAYLGSMKSGELAGYEHGLGQAAGAVAGLVRSRLSKSEARAPVSASPSCASWPNSTAVP